LINKLKYFYKIDIITINDKYMNIKFIIFFSLLASTFAGYSNSTVLVALYTMPIFLSISAFALYSNRITKIAI
jgi:hypothetical protein